MIRQATGAQVTTPLLQRQVSTNWQMSLPVNNSNCGQGGHIEQLERAHEAIAHKTKKKGNHAVEKVVTFKGIIRTPTQIKFPMVTPFRPE